MISIPTFLPLLRTHFFSRLDIRHTFADRSHSWSIQSPGKLAIGCTSTFMVDSPRILSLLYYWNFSKFSMRKHILIQFMVHVPVMSISVYHLFLRMDEDGGKPLITSNGQYVQRIIRNLWISNEGSHKFYWYIYIYV